MSLRQKFTLHLLIYIALCSGGWAQTVDIPDHNLRAAIVDALNMPLGTPITQTDMARLLRLDATNQGIAKLVGLESATNLTKLYIGGNPINDLSPIAGLIHLETLVMWSISEADITQLTSLVNLQYLDIAGCNIIDLSPLAHLIQLTVLNARFNDISNVAPLENLTNLEALRLSRNRISDVTPLASLKKLVKLWLDDNRITDVTPLAALTSLEHLEIELNRIVDISPLNTLSLSHFIYDQECEIPPLLLEPRLESRTYPSVFTRWNIAPITNRPELTRAENQAHHDLRWGLHPFGLKFKEADGKFIRTGDLAHAIHFRDELIALNPNMLFLVDIEMRSTSLDTFPHDWPYWIRDENGNIFIERPDGIPAKHGLMDFTHPHVQDRIVQQAIAASKCGLYDGIHFDFWSEAWPILRGWDGTQNRQFRTMEAEQRARDNILARIRAETRPDFLIIGNTNGRIIPRTAPYVNGSFMETGLPGPKTGAPLDDDLIKLENSLLWLEENLRQPRINALETCSIPTERPDSLNNLRWMRAVTALSLTHSDGYVLFQPCVEDGHYWYDFWDADLGRPLSEETAQLYDDDITGLYIREFTNGWAVYNHSGEAQAITLPEEVQGVASGLVNTEHALPNLDGEMYLRVKPKNPADVNGDGVVNILDLTIIAQAFGTDSLKGDVNGDGEVNILDLVFVANEF